MRTWAVAAEACVVMAALAACASTPAPRFHSLLSTAPAAAREPNSPGLRIELAPVAVPASVDQPQWVVRTADDTLRLLEQERWVAPLRDELRAALAERLAQRWGAVDVRMTPMPSAAWRINVDVQRFESVAGREAWLDSNWSAVPSSGNGSPWACRSTLRESAVGDMAALAAAHRRAITRLADQIGANLSALNRGQTPSCAPPDAAAR